MKLIQLQSISAITLLAAIVTSQPLNAAGPTEVRWNQVCQATIGNELLVTMANGDTVEGYCDSISVDELRVKTQDHGVVKIARTALSRIQMRRAKGHQVRTLGHDLHQSLTYGVDTLLSPWAVGGLVMLPATLAWGAVALPFCLLGDLNSKLSGTQEIKPL